MIIGDLKILVLNSDYRPINITSFKKGYKLVYKGKAEIVLSDPNNKFKTSYEELERPKIIRLMEYVYIPFYKVTLSKQNIFKRDGFKCAYCYSTFNLTVDHVIPKSRGGKNNWENLVTCCLNCNHKKDNRTPEEAGMSLLIKPYIPTFSKLLGISKDDLFKLLFNEAENL